LKTTLPTSGKGLLFSNLFFYFVDRLQGKGTNDSYRRISIYCLPSFQERRILFFS
jgi:hypothetical protein